jgi:hypothetical protein
VGHCRQRRRIQSSAPRSSSWAFFPTRHGTCFSARRRASRLNSSIGHGCSGRLAGNAAIRTRHRSRVRARVAPATHELRTKTILTTRLHTNRVARKERGFPDELAVAGDLPRRRQGRLRNPVGIESENRSGIQFRQGT